MATTTTAATEVTLPPGDPYAEYEWITDDTGLLEMRVPTAWSDQFGGAWELDGDELGPGLNASVDISAWFDGWSTPGVFLGATTMFEITPDEYLDELSFFDDQCTYDGREDYDDGEYAGRFDTWAGCGGLPSAFFALASEPYGSAGTLVVVEMIIVTEADLDALDSVLSSFRLLGDP
jgi:hypothetical protein